MPEEIDPLFGHAFRSANQTLNDLDTSIREGRSLFVLDTIPSERRTKYLLQFYESLRHHVPLSGNDWFHLHFTSPTSGARRFIRKSRNLNSSPTAPALSILRLQRKHANAVSSHEYVRNNQWRITLIYLGPFMFFVGPNLVTIGSAGLDGTAKEALVALGSVLSALPIFSTLLKKSHVLDLRKDLEQDVEHAINQHNIQAANELGFAAAWNWIGYLAADLANVTVGSWAAFRGNVVWGIGNASPDIIGICVILPILIHQADKIGAEQFPHDIDGISGRFNDFVSEDQERKRERRAEAQRNVNRKSAKTNVYILIYALISLVIHIVLVLKSSRHRSNNAFIYDDAVPSIINFIAATYIMARLMQQMFPNYLMAHVRAEWGAHIWRGELQANMDQCFQHLREIQDIVKGMDIPHDISKAAVRMMELRGRLCFLKLFVDVPGALIPHNDDMYTATEICSSLNAFTVLQTSLDEIKKDFSHLATDPEWTLIPAPLIIEDLRAEADNKAKLASIESYKRQLDNKVVIYRGFQEIHSKMVAFDERMRELEASLQEYYERLKMTMPFVTLPKRSEGDTFKSRVLELTTTLVDQDIRLFDSVPAQIRNTIADKTYKLLTDLDRFSHLEERIRNEKMNATAHSPMLEHVGEKPAELEQAGTTEGTASQAETSDDDQIRQLQTELDSSIGNLEQCLRDWIREYCRLLWPGSDHELAQRPQP